jgi:primosomal protein N'
LKELRIKYGKDFYFLEGMKSPINKIKNKHRYQIVLRFSNKITDIVLKEIYEKLDKLKNNKLSVFVETNPLSLS